MGIFISWTFSLTSLIFYFISFGKASLIFLVRCFDTTKNQNRKPRNLVPT